MADPVSVVGFSPQHAAAFRDLNVEWLERYFRVEPIDARVLGDPERYIIEPGGEILFALDAGAALGCCALKRDGDAIELTKMAVTEAAQGRGIGTRLLAAAIDWYRAQPGMRCLYLESHSSLGAALHLYRAHGFVDAPRPFTSEYERSDVYMEWRG